MTEQIDIARVTGKLAELDKQVSVQEERMNTRHAETESALDRMRADMARLVADSAKRDVDAAKRDKDNLRFHIGLWIAAVVVLGVLIRWPG